MRHAYIISNTKSDDQISMDSDLPPCSQPPPNSQDANKFSVLPLTKSGKVDILYIDKLRQHESSSKTFHQFCLNRNFLQQMIESGLEFGYPSHFTNSILEDRFDLLKSLYCGTALSVLTNKPTTFGSQAQNIRRTNLSQLKTLQTFSIFSKKLPTSIQFPTSNSTKL